jgi:hypothetical protein
VKLTQDREPVEPGQKQVEDHRVVRARERTLQPCRPISGRVNAETLRLQAASEEREDSGFVLDDQDLHRRGYEPNADDLQMTRK